MTQDKPACTSSDETAASQHWPETARLGERIVNELDLDNSTDTLARWMAHRVAELMQRVDTGNEQAAREASDLILRLWRQRSDWPEGWPPPHSVEALRALTEPAEPHRRPGADSESHVDGNPWLTRLAIVKRLLDDELQTWRNLALAWADVDAEIAWAAGTPAALSDDEEQVFERLAFLKQLALRHFESGTDGDVGDEQRIAQARRELEDCQRSRLELFQNAAATEGTHGLSGDDPT